MNNLIWSFAPWAAFLVGVRFGSVYWGAAIGLAAAAAVLVRAISRHSVHLFDTVGVVYFAGLLILLAAIHPGDMGVWGRYAQAVAHGSLTAIVFGSILIGRPFTEPYAREKAPREVWHAKAFHELNRRISAVFGFAFLIGTASLILAGTQDSRQFILRLVIPFGALFLALMYTQKQVQRVGHEVSRA
jgi:all-trans-retinol 13,14-reductase